MLPDIQRVHDYQVLAKAKLDPAIWQYLCEGDSSGNAQAWHNRYLMPRPLRDVTGGNTRLTIFGQTLEHPILLAPLAYQRLFHQQGEMASAMAASMQGAPFIISSLASQALEAIADVAHAERQKSAWFQLYWQGERDRTLRLLQRAINADCSVVVFTVDAPIKIASLQLPADVFAVNLEPLPIPQSKTSAVFNGWMSQAPTWDDVIWLRQQTRLPLVLKGLLHPDDVEKAIAVGCDGIVVSNHGGRVLDSAPPSLLTLETICKRVSDRIPILFDSGIRSGRDIFVALAMGATAVLLGRPYLWGLTVNGALGVSHIIRLLRDELEMTMALTGCKHLRDIGAPCLYSPTSHQP